MTMENLPKKFQPAGRRTILGIIGGAIAATFFGERALAAKKPPVKKVVKKPVKKAPVKKAPPKPVAKSTPKPSASPKASATPSPTASATPSATATPSPSATASASPSASATPTPTVATAPSDAKALTVAGKNLTVSDLAVGGTTVATFPKNGVTTTVLVTRVDEKTFLALKPICTHAGGPVELSGGSLLCSWHFSRFSAKTGEVITGPAAAPLPSEKTAVFGEIVYYLP